MTEREMEGLLWKYPGEFFTEYVKPVSRQQPCSSGGRMDLVFSDIDGAFIIAELKQGAAPRSASGQLLEYRCEMLRLHPGSPIRLMLIAESIAPNYRAGLESVNIEYLEIREARYLEVAVQKGEAVLAGSPARRRIPVLVKSGASGVPTGAPSVVPAASAPTPDRQRRRNSFESGSFYSKVFEIARDRGVSIGQIHHLAIEEGAFDVEGRVRSTLTNLFKGVRRRGGLRDGHRGLIWEVSMDGIAVGINSSAGSAGLSVRIDITDVRRLDGLPFDY